jgi:hypothetical protein
MCKNTKTTSPPQSMIQPVGEMAGLLTHARIQDDKLRQTLRVLCHSISAHAGFLFRKVYDPSEAFQIEALSRWAAGDDDRAMTLTAEDIPDSIWEALEGKEIVHSEDFISGFPISHSQAWFLPLFLGEYL